MSNMIVGMVWNYDWKAIEPFFKSLAQSGFDGQCMLLVHNLPAETIAHLESHGVEMVAFDPGQYSPQHFNNTRWFGFHHYFDRLAGSGDLPDAVLFTDIRDLAFQGDPFGDHGEGVNCYLEAKKIIDCKHNRRWIRECYGEETLDRIGRETIICAGTTLVTRNHIMDYLAAMTTGLDSLADTSKAIIADQAVHNFIVRTGRIQNVVLHEIGDHVLTINPYRKQHFSVSNDSILNSHGKACPIVHQYDRDSAAIQAIGNRLGIKEMPFADWQPKKKQGWLRRVTKPARHAVLSVVKWPTDRLAALVRPREKHSRH